LSESSSYSYACSYSYFFRIPACRCHALTSQIWWRQCNETAFDCTQCSIKLFLDCVFLLCLGQGV
jgi:hypothetical protein